MPPPTHVPTERDRRMVRMMVAGGIIYDDIAAAIGISRSTLKTRYKTELDTDPREEMRKRRH